MPDDTPPDSIEPRPQQPSSRNLTPSRAASGTRPSNAWQPPAPEELQGQIAQYEILELVGRGGMGAVYKGRQTSLQRFVAIKIMPPGIDDADSQFAERFKREARTMAKFHHPGIVSVYDAGETADGLLYIVMEFVEGTDVAQMVKSQGRLSADYALAITAHVCDALQYAHTRGVMHRDIKPANIMVNMEGAVKVADFGLAKGVEHGQGGGLTRTNMAMGTPDYVAPEALITGLLVDHRADLYAVGVMLYNMLTGEIPRGVFKPPSQKVGSDPRFDAIIMKAMEQEREGRYQSATEIRRDLDVILTTARVKAEPPQQAGGAARKPVGRGPQPRSGGIPAAGPREKETGGISTPAPKKKSSSTAIYSIGAAVIVVAAVAVFMFSGGGKQPASEPKSAAETPLKTAKSDPQPAARSTPGATNKSPTPPSASVTAAKSSEVRAFGGHRYQLVLEKLKWPEAKARAASMGGHLATITSKAENDWIYGRITSRLKRTKGDINSDRCYIGASRQKAPDASWELVTGQPLTVQPWMGTFPDDRDAAPKVATLLGRRWDDVNTSFAPLAFLVEWDDDGGTTKPAASSATPGVVDLLALVNVKRDAVKGDWEVTDAGLVATKATGAQLLGFTHAPPEEYDFEIEFTLKDGIREASQVLPVPGGSILWKMGMGGGGGLTPFCFGPMLDGKEAQKDSERTEALIRRPRLSTNRRYRSVVEVRKESLRASIDGNEVLAWSGDLRRFANESVFKLPNQAHPGVASYGTSVVFHKAELRPPATPPAQPVAAAAMPAASVNSKSEIPNPQLDDPRLAQLEAGFKTRYEADAQKPFLAAVASLNQNEKALDDYMAELTKAGRLDQAKRVQTLRDNMPVPSQEAGALRQ